MNSSHPNVAPRFLTKKACLWALALIGLIDGFVFLLSREHRSLSGGEQLFAMFAMNVAMLGWCVFDAEERKVPISGWLRFTMLALPIVGLPWYFLRSRGFVGAAKVGFGYGLFAVWFVAMMLSAIAVAVAQTLLLK